MKSIYLLLFCVLFSVQYKIHAQCFHAGQNLPSTGLMMSSSGDKELDSLVVSEIKSLERFYGVNVDFFFLLEASGMNAMYHPVCNSNCNGTILLGIKMLYSELHKTNGVYTTKAILAHEFGHCIQHIIGWKENWKRPELFSDFMAGYYMGKTYAYTQSELDVLFKSFYDMGDMAYWSESHHGTGSERQCAFLEGYFFAKENKTALNVAANYAIQYVVADNPCAVRKYKEVLKVINNDEKKSEVIKQKNKGRAEIRDLSTGSSNTVKITFKTTDKRFYEITAPGIGVCGKVSGTSELVIIVDKNSEYKFIINKYRRTLFGKRGSIKSIQWVNSISFTKDYVWYLKI